MKILRIAQKTLLELWREPMLFLLLLAFPILMLLFYSIAFGSAEQGLAHYLTVMVLNEDTGTLKEGLPWRASDQLLDNLRKADFEGKPIFTLARVADRAVADITLHERKAALLLVIPPNFSQAVLEAAAEQPDAPPANLNLVGDPNSDNYVFARSLLDSYFTQFTLQVTGWQESLATEYEFLPGTGTMSDFQFGVPGVIAFGIMFVTISTAMTMVRENVTGTLRRLRLTRATAADLLPGVTLAQMVLALIIVPFTFGAAYLLGFRSQGSFLLAIGIGLLLTVSAVGLGLITACFAHNDGEAANLAATVAVLMSLLSGAMYPMPRLPLFSVAGRTIQLYDMLPPMQAGEALRRVLVLGDGAGAIAYELGMLATLAVIILGTGIVLYQKLQMRNL